METPKNWMCTCSHSAGAHERLNGECLIPSCACACFRDVWNGERAPKTPEATYGDVKKIQISSLLRLMASARSLAALHRRSLEYLGLYSGLSEHAHRCDCCGRTALDGAAIQHDKDCPVDALLSAIAEIQDQLDPEPNNERSNASSTAQERDPVVEPAREFFAGFNPWSALSGVALSPHGPLVTGCPERTIEYFAEQTA
jgi:hypothetical protein